MGSENFDDRAADWDSDPDKVSRARDVAAAVRAAVQLQPATRLLEYGAGTGLVSQELRAHVGQIVLADNSTGMRQVIQEKIEAGVLSDAQVWDLDLEHDVAPPEEFDLIVTSMVMHHVRDVPAVLAGFASLLRPGGHVCITDLDTEDGSFHDSDFHGHHGIDRGELSEQLEQAGFAGATITDCTTIIKRDHAYSVFLATATR
ncbi:class I SAM-dependent methyltransferase [Ornithinimicrobium faecis]|uniref:Class I SAM-dependent methyltransferase n=1 Tax=Ornithinimicrobium faecis TaxID=2934158 RepID=A0ABY4YQL9_9MICO|nr:MULTISPECIES: class I SAM-dependent methyltransferase [unclassified Ornithinimicrobium]USQ78861.1 class I SAM-dependent methyltransferase [Ornithinimicrobium sp. HY1793]